MGIKLALYCVPQLSSGYDSVYHDPHPVPGNRGRPTPMRRRIFR